jgi:RHS repeat-associated protein
MAKNQREGLGYGYNFLNLLGDVKSGSTVKATYRWLADGTKAGVKTPAGTAGYEYLGSLIYTRNSTGGLDLESAAFGGGRIEVSKDIDDNRVYATSYHLTDHLGSVRVAFRDKDTVLARNDFYPFGKPHVNNLMPMADDQRNRWLFNGKENQLTADLRFLDYGARMYDSEINRWFNADLLAEVNPKLTPFHFSSNNPVNRIDVDGRWDIKVHLYNNRAEYGYGIAVVTDRNGNEVQRFEVRAEGVGGRDRNVRGADTPLGVYDIPAGDTWRASTNGNRMSYGPNDRLVMNPDSGEIVQTGRDAIRIHGGRQESYNPKTDTWSAVSNPSLKKTEGCLRAYDSDMATLKETTTNLQNNDSSEVPGSVTIVDDLQKTVTPASTTNMIEVNTTYEMPEDPRSRFYSGGW